ncbi:MAG: hypothetical protein GY819_11270 [Planctomycetaceae bacterium]|nr:hypothetical protein [Planctomycetaceae bacterium]
MPRKLTFDYAIQDLIHEEWLSQDGKEKADCLGVWTWEDETRLHINKNRMLIT